MRARVSEREKEKERGSESERERERERTFTPSILPCSHMEEKSEWKLFHDSK